MTMEITELTAKVIGKKLGQNLYAPTGNLLLREGTIITPFHYSCFKEIGHKSIYVQKNDLIEYDPQEHIISERLHAKAPTTLKNIFNKLKSADKSKVYEAKSELKALANSLITSVRLNKQKRANILDLKRQDDYLFQHTIDVLAYSILIGQSLQYNFSRLSDLALAALLHDFGMLDIENSILYKVSNLKQSEIEKMKEHTIKGFQHLGRHCSFSGLVTLAALQHHERIDGLGYPKNISGNAIHEYSKIIALADFFDAYTSDRPYRRLHTIDEAIEFIKSDKGKYFDPSLIPHLLKFFK